MNILDWITDLVVTAWELIGLMFRSGISEAIILQEDERDRDGKGSRPGRGGRPSANGGVRQAQFA